MTKVRTNDPPGAATSHSYAVDSFSDGLINNDVGGAQVALAGRGAGSTP